MRSSTPLAAVAFLLAFLGLCRPSAPFGGVASARGDAGGGDGVGNQGGEALRLDVGEVERRVLAARQAIRTGEFEIAVATDVNGRKADDKFHTWVGAGGRIRQQRRFRDQDQVFVRNADDVYFYDRRPGLLDNPDRLQRHAVQTWPAKAAPAAGFRYAACDPRVFMLTPSAYSLPYTNAFDTLVGGAGREGVRVKEGLLEGRRVLTVSFSVPRKGNEIEYEYDVSPERGYAVVRWRMRGQMPVTAGRKEPFETIVTCRPAEVAAGVWFPEAVERTESRAGKPYRRETVSVRVVSVNKGVEDKTFTLANGDLPAGVLVAPGQLEEGEERPAERPPPRIWDGKELRAPMPTRSRRATGRPCGAARAPGRPRPAGPGDPRPCVPVRPV